ncbi:MAG: putative acyl-CoA thioester hydrolase [Rhizobiaceae bacterium]|nr:putative acyl-CoA thioester hydrolase [Rhizobiaceae bacterium]
MLLTGKKAEAAAGGPVCRGIRVDALPPDGYGSASARCRRAGSVLQQEAPELPASDDLPTGQLTLRTLAMPADANAAGDIFGGWVMAQMDLACGIRAAERARGRVVTAAVREMSFASPMKIGDTLCIYTDVVRVGRTSMTLKVEAWAQRYLQNLMEKVTDADFVMVALDAEGRPTPVPPDL